MDSVAMSLCASKYSTYWPPRISFYSSPNYFTTFRISVKLRTCNYINQVLIGLADITLIFRVLYNICLLQSIWYKNVLLLCNSFCGHLLPVLFLCSLRTILLDVSFAKLRIHIWRWLPKLRVYLLALLAHNKLQLN